VLGFLGHKLHGAFTGEVMTDVKTEREPGASDHRFASVPDTA